VALLLIEYFPGRVHVAFEALLEKLVNSLRAERLAVIGRRRWRLALAAGEALLEDLVRLELAVRAWIQYLPVWTHVPVQTLVEELVGFLRAERLAVIGRRRLALAACQALLEHLFGPDVALAVIENDSGRVHVALEALVEELVKLPHAD
jgi:hypothetical protein